MALSEFPPSPVLHQEGYNFNFVNVGGMHLDLLHFGSSRANEPRLSGRIARRIRAFPKEANPTDSQPPGIPKEDYWL
eukprot:1997173-Rhodomonas_salina.1